MHTKQPRTRAPHAICRLLVTFTLVSMAVNALADTATVERGRYIVEVIAACGNCHTPMGPQGPDMSNHLAGGGRYSIKGMNIITPNLTPDVETGIGGWSDDEIIRAFREGIRPDGRVLGPMMPYAFYRQISDADATAIVAYLRTLKPVENELEISTYDFPLPERWGPPLGEVPHPDLDEPQTLGAYLAGPLGHCMECHSTPGPTGAPDLENGFGGGGWAFPGPWGTSVAANLTPTGIGHRSDDDLRRMITTGTRPDGSRMLPPMPYANYANLAREDLDAIIVYLRSLEPR